MPHPLTIHFQGDNMRPEGMAPSLGELMGKAGEKKELGLKDLPDLLGEKMPELPANRLGRFRLINALQERFGAGFRNLPMVSKILKEFDENVETENTIRLNKKGRG